MGGSINSMGNLDILNTDFTGNCAGEFGGAISTQTMDAEFNFNIANSSLTNNTAPKGGAVANVAHFKIESSKFIDNHTYESGGAIISTGHSNIIFNVFTNNVADGNGGVINSTNYCELRANNLTNNRANHEGGALLSIGSSEVSYNNFIGNNATQGGAIFNTYQGDLSYPNSKIISNNFTNNRAKKGFDLDLAHARGAILNLGPLYLSNNTFVENLVENGGLGGGAIINGGENSYMYLQGGNLFFHKTIQENTEAIGGGINNTNSGHLFVSGPNNTFIDSNIYNRAYMELRDCTIQKNNEYGNHLKNLNPGGLKLTNCSVIKSFHYLDQKNHMNYFAPPMDVVFTHIDNFKSIVVHKSQKYELKAQLIGYPIPFRENIIGKTLNFKIYNKDGLILNNNAQVGVGGYARTSLDPSKLVPGNYMMEVSYGGYKPCIGTQWFCCNLTAHLTVLP